MPEGEILTKSLWSLYEAKINPLKLLSPVIRNLTCHIHFSATVKSFSKTTPPPLDDHATRTTVTLAFESTFYCTWRSYPMCCLGSDDQQNNRIDSEHNLTYNYMVGLLSCPTVPFTCIM